MPGQIKRMLDSIVVQRSKGNPTLAITTKTKLILKGANPDGYNATSPDDPVVVTRIKEIAAEMGVRV